MPQWEYRKINLNDVPRDHHLIHRPIARSQAPAPSKTRDAPRIHFACPLSQTISHQFGQKVCHADEMQRPLAMTTFLLTITLTGSPAPGQILSGQWCGEADQTGPGTYRSRWSATLVLNGSTGRMDYPSLECGGTLTFEHVNGAVHFYRERIDYGRDLCLDGGLIGVEPLGASVRWEWNGSGATAIAVLTAQCWVLSEHTTPQHRIINVTHRASPLPVSVTRTSSTAQ
jgi:hypothetical protein